MSSKSIASELHAFATSILPFNRSLTGEGVFKTLTFIQSFLPDLRIHSVKSGTKVFDWVVPKEWSVKQAFIIRPDGKRICDFSECNLHLVGYSAPFRGTMDLAKLQDHLHSLPDQPSAVPYVTSYYNPHYWGFCISDEERKKLPQGDYEVVVDTDLFDGEMYYGELEVSGKFKHEILLSTYVCHPSMANNEISGPTVLSFLCMWLQSLGQPLFSHRALFIPETIGSITYISQNLDRLKNTVIAGFNISCVGDDRAYSFIPTRNGNTLSDKVALHVLKWHAPNFKKYSWLDRGSDERQYNAPGVDLPIASILRTKFGDFPEYHTSLDDLETVVTPAGLFGGYEALRLSLEVLNNHKRFKSNVLCEPFLTKHGLYPTLSEKAPNFSARKFLDILSLCDGEKYLIDIAEIIDVPSWEIYSIMRELEKKGLVSEIRTSVNDTENYFETPN